MKAEALKLLQGHAPVPKTVSDTNDVFVLSLFWNEGLDVTIPIKVILIKI